MNQNDYNQNSGLNQLNNLNAVPQNSTPENSINTGGIVNGQIGQSMPVSQQTPNVSQVQTAPVQQVVTNNSLQQPIQQVPIMQAQVQAIVPVTPSSVVQQPMQQSVQQVIQQPVQPVQQQVVAQPIQQVETLDEEFRPNNLNTSIPNNTAHNVSSNQQSKFSFFNQDSQINKNNDNDVNKNYFREQNDVTPSILHTTSIQNINNIKMKKIKSEKGNTFQVISISTGCILLSIFMLATLAFNMHFYHISGTSMEPTIPTKAWVLSSASEEYTYGDIIAFHHDNVVMIKRIIALPGDEVNIDESGNVYVNGKPVDEPYLSKKELGKPEIDFPHTVHPETYFVLGDNRGDSIDSRNIAVGGVKTTDVIGKVRYSIFPYKKLK